MTPSRSPFFVGAALLVGGAFYFQTDSVGVHESVGERVADAAVKEPVQTRDAVAASPESPALAKLARVADPPPLPEVVLGENPTALLTEQIALQALAGEADLHLSAREWTGFAGVTQYHQAVRRAYEAEIAVQKRSSLGRHRFEIPLYPRAGDQLRAAFYASLRAELGAAAAEEIAQKLGARLEDYFGGFGVAIQTLDLVADRNAEQRDFIVTRTETFWNQLRPDERLKTRRETFLIAAEDPTGAEWGALLIARLAAQGEAGRAGS